MRTRVVVFTALITVTVAARADETTDKQKKVAAENLAKADITKPTIVETASLFVCSELPEAKTKTLADTCQMAHALAAKTLQFDSADPPWKGKLTVYYLPERKSFNLFMRAVAGERPQEPYFYSLKGDEPYLLDGIEPAAKATDADQFGEAGALTAAAVLTRKGGTAEFPDWVKMGFGHATQLRSEGMNSARYTAYKTSSRRAVLGGAGRPAAAVTSVWEGGGKDTDVLATSLMDYFAYGPGKDNFLKFVNGFKPGEANDKPGVAEALVAGGWKPEMLDASWKKWVQSGK